MSADVVRFRLSSSSCGRSEGRPQVDEQARSNGGPARPAVTFAELARVHFLWRDALACRRPAADEEQEYLGTLERFEKAYGPIVDAYWCSSVESAVALTERTRRIRWWPDPTPKSELHRVSDWASRGEPDVATELHACDELAVRAAHVLTGIRRRVCMRLVMAYAAHLLSLVDEKAAHPEAEHLQTALAKERLGLQDVRHYYREAANGQAQIVYFAGMAISVTIVVGLGLGLWLTIGQRHLLAALIAGGVGAVVSVIQRIDERDFDVEFDVGRRYVLFLGSLRPVIGAVFGMAFSLAVTANIVNLPGVAKNGEAQFAALAVIAFFAGFSERWAKDTLASELPSTHPAGGARARPPGGV